MKRVNYAISCKENRYVKTYYSDCIHLTTLKCFIWEQVALINEVFNVLWANSAEHFSIARSQCISTNESIKWEAMTMYSKHETGTIIAIECIQCFNVIMSENQLNWFAMNWVTRFIVSDSDIVERDFHLNCIGCLMGLAFPGRKSRQFLAIALNLKYLLLFCDFLLLLGKVEWLQAEWRSVSLESHSLLLLPWTASINYVYSQTD